MSLQDQIAFIREEAHIRRGLIGVQKFSANRPPPFLFTDERRLQWFNAQRPRIVKSKLNCHPNEWWCYYKFTRPDGHTSVVGEYGPTPEKAFRAWKTRWMNRYWKFKP